MRIMEIYGKVINTIDNLGKAFEIINSIDNLHQDSYEGFAAGDRPAQSDRGLCKMQNERAGRAP